MGSKPHRNSSDYKISPASRPWSVSVHQIYRTTELKWIQPTGLGVIPIYKLEKYGYPFNNLVVTPFKEPLQNP